MDLSMTNSPTTAGRRSELLRRCALVALAAGAGSAGVWLTSDVTRCVVARGVAIRTLDARAMALVFGPGVAGAGLLVAALLLSTRRRIALGVYWGAVFVAVAVELLSRFGCFDLSTPPGGETQVVFISPDFDESILWHMGEVSLLGLLIVMGHWLSAPRSGEDRGVVATTPDPGPGESIKPAVG
jgi:hypothetical protein